MKHSEILKRAWKILWDYKALWIFGVILAIADIFQRAAVQLDNEQQHQ